MAADRYRREGHASCGRFSCDPRSVVWIRGVVFLLAVAMLAAAGCGRRPAARGKTLGEWMDLLKRSSDPAELKETAAALAELGPLAEPAAWELVRLLSDRQAFGHYRSLNEVQVREVYTALAEALRSIGATTAPAVVQVMENGRPMSADVMNALHDSALRELTKAFAHPNMKVRRAIAERWRDLGPKGRHGAPMLIAALRDPDAIVRREAAKSLAAVDPDPGTAVPALAGATDDESAAVRLAAVEGLGGFPSEAAVSLPALALKLGDADPAVSAAATASLARFRGREKDVVPLLAKILADLRSPARRAAMRAAIGADVLALLPSQALVPFIEPSGGETNAAVKAEEELFSVKSVEALLQADPKAALFVPALAGRLRQADDASTAPRQDALARIGAPAVPVLARMLSYTGDSTSPSEREVQEAEVVRYEAAKALEAIGAAAAQAVSALQQMSTDEPNEHVRSAAIEALRRIKADQRDSRKRR